MVRKKTTPLLLLLILLLSLTPLSSALSSENGSTAQYQESWGSVKYLEKEDVLKVVENNIQEYLKTDIQTEGKLIEPSTEFTHLYDFEGNLFAYMVPLMEQGREIGYITVGAIEDGYATYEIFIKDDIVSLIKSKLHEKAKSSDKKSQLVYSPPLTYIIKVEDGLQEEYYNFSDFTTEVDISELVTKNKSLLQEQYHRLRSEDNRVHLNNQLHHDSNQSILVTEENVSLTSERDFGMFVPVEYSSGKYSYGGNQMWWPDGSNKEVRGCGPVAAANITNYLAKVKDSTKYGKLYSGNTTSYTDFMRHMDTLYSYIDPGMFGEVSVSDFASDVERYAKDKGVTLSRVTSSASFTLDNTANYIKAGLGINSPVGTLNTKKWSDYEYEWHWMTITKYFRSTSDNRWIAVSTWGERLSIDYRVHFDAMKNGWVQGGIMYFK